MTFQYRIDEQIAIFALDNGKVNAITRETLGGLQQAVEQVNGEEALKGLVITGQGHYFSGGFDLGTFTSFQDEAAITDWFRAEEEALLQLFTCEKPVVCAINGHATAAGMILSMACDYRLVSNNSRIKIGMTEIKIGLALTPAELEIMRFGLSTDKNFRDLIFQAVMLNPAQAVDRGIYDELAETSEDMLERAKRKVNDFIDTPGSHLFY